MGRTGRSAVVGCLLAVALLGGSCATPGGGAAASNFKFRVSKVTVVNHNDSFLYGVRDETFSYQLWFRVKVGVANSAQVGLVGDRADAFNDLGDGQTHVNVGGERSEVNFGGVQLLDLVDLVLPSTRLEVVGTWTWAMDRDDVSVAGVANDTLTVIRNALNATVAAGTLPTDANALVSQLFGDFGQAFNLIAGALFASIPGIPDDPIGSRFYVGIPAKGTLSTLVDAAVAGLDFPSVAIPIISVPPDIGGGEIFSLGHNSTFSNQVMDQGNGRHDIEVQIIDAATINQAPFSNFTKSVSSGTAPLAVSFNGGPSADPDGTVVSYNWNFGDFTTGTGPINSHTFTTSGTFPVTLTVTDDDGESTSSTQNVSVGGAPTVAPSGLTLTGSGCCDTYGDFAWTPVAGATDYEISMDGFFLGGCVTDHSAVVAGQRSNGRVQAVGLCLGSQYDSRIRAKANGLWGPWSGSVRVTL